MSEREFFSTTWDNLVKGVTSIVLGLIISFMVLFTFIPDLPTILRTVIIILYVAIVLVPFLWAPRGYILHKNLIIIKRIIGDERIIVSEKSKIWKWKWWGIRLWASGGLYGYFGIFFFREIGKVKMYATNRNNLVLVKDANNTKYLVSPDNLDKFMDLLNRSLVA
ncbi:MAG: PH domain-containing protein [Candidatus Thorarchaeota archaeon]